MNDEALPGSGVDRRRVLGRAAPSSCATFAPRHREVLAERDRLQAQIDEWHREHRGRAPRPGRLPGVPRVDRLPRAEPASRSRSTRRTSTPRSRRSPGRSSSCRSTNARYALNAANARWGRCTTRSTAPTRWATLPEPGPYDPARGARVVAWARAFLDDVVPLDGGSHADVVALLRSTRPRGRSWPTRADGATRGLRDAAALAGYRGAPDDPSALLLEHHGLGIELVIDRAHPVGAADAAGVADVVLESAVTTIVDFEDSVATVDGPDKVGAYRNWLGLMKGDLDRRGHEGRHARSCARLDAGPRRTPASTVARSSGGAGRCCWSATSAT